LVYNPICDFFHTISSSPWFQYRGYQEDDLTNQTQYPHPIAVIGAGPAGLYAAKLLASHCAEVALINRDVKPGGLAEYGIFHNKHKMKSNLRKQFDIIMNIPNIHYYGNVVVGEKGDIQLNELKELGFKAIMVTIGAQGTKWLGLPGEDLKGVYHAKDLVYHYNQLPPFAEQEYPIGDRVVIIGMGNVMMDIANYCTRDLKVKEVTTIGRRGPAEVKFTKKEMANLIKNLDLEHLDAEIARTTPVMEKCGQDPEAAKSFILSAMDKASEPVSGTRFRIDFLTSPKAIIGDENGNVTGLEVDETTLELRESGGTKAVRLGTTHVIPCDTVIFCIGDRVDEGFGLPLNQWKEFAKHPKPKHPINETSFEAYNPETKKEVEGVFLAGWAREASSGLVGMAKKDGECGAKALFEYLEGIKATEIPEKAIEALESKLNKLPKAVVHKNDLLKLVAAEKRIADEQGLEAFKFSSNEEMLKEMGL
jgi:ferredoxin--NADP+ reductase